MKLNPHVIVIVLHGKEQQNAWNAEHDLIWLCILCNVEEKQWYVHGDDIVL